MRKTILTVALVGTLGLGGGALLSPSLASAATGTGTAPGAVSSRLTAITNALKGLVSDNTLTQAQADKVASTLDSTLPRHGFGGRGGRGAHLGPQELATVLGITPQELRTALQSGKTLTQVAASKNISRTDLIARLVAAGKARLAQQVKDGHLTQAQADTAAGRLPARVAAEVDRTGFGPGGHGRGARPDGDADDAPRGASPSTPASPAPAAPSSSTGNVAYQAA